MLIIRYNPAAHVQARVRAELRDCREVEAREVRGIWIVQRAAGGLVGLWRQRGLITAKPAAVLLADLAIGTRLRALVAAATCWRYAGEHGDHHHALHHHHRRAGEQAAATLDCVCILWIESGEVNVGSGVKSSAQ